MIVFRPGAAFAFSHPAHFIALGFGAGLVPVSPGTAGTLLAVPILWLIPAGAEPAVLAAAIAAAFALGVWACGLTGRHLGIPDHRAMVWDETVAFLLVLAVLPRELAWQAAGFALFRIFDVAKPPPIRAIERRFQGGFGVMFDDMVAAGFTLLALAVARRVFF